MAARKNRKRNIMETLTSSRKWFKNYDYFCNRFNDYACNAINITTLFVDLQLALNPELQDRLEKLFVIALNDYQLLVSETKGAKEQKKAIEEIIDKIYERTKEMVIKQNGIEHCYRMSNIVKRWWVIFENETCKQSLAYTLQSAESLFKVWNESETHQDELGKARYVLNRYKSQWEIMTYFCGTRNEVINLLETRIYPELNKLPPFDLTIQIKI